MARGALGPAAELFEEAAVSGDPNIVLGLAECYYATDELGKAQAQFAKVRTSGEALLRSHALEGLARIALRQGRTTG